MMKNDTGMAKIGILCWEAGQVPRGLMQLETLIGNSTNPASYDYPVRFHRVRGANVHTILENPDPDVLRTMITDAQAMAWSNAPNGGACLPSRIQKSIWR